mgnify:CR=1 FL=1
MGRIEDLCERYQRLIALPWQRTLSGDQKTIFIVYPKIDERRLRLRLPEFEMATTAAGHGWLLCDLTDAFAQWMVAHEYREAYFEDPGVIHDELETSFMPAVAETLRKTLRSVEADENAVVAVHGVASLYGLTRLSLVLREIVNDIRGRLVVFFPGEYEQNNYRLLDARDGFNYLALPVTLHDGGMSR